MLFRLGFPDPRGLRQELPAGIWRIVFLFYMRGVFRVHLLQGRPTSRLFSCTSKRFGLVTSRLACSNIGPTHPLAPLQPRYYDIFILRLSRN